MRLITCADQSVVGVLPQEFDRMSTLLAQKSSAVSNFESLMNNDGPSDSHWIGSKRQPGAAGRKNGFQANNYRGEPRLSSVASILARPGGAVKRRSYPFFKMRLRPDCRRPIAGPRAVAEPGCGTLGAVL